MKVMKDSGIAWVGIIPSHWIIHPVYYYFGERKNKNKFGQEENLLSLSYGKIIRKDINTSEGLLPESFNTYNIVEKGDIVIRPTDLQNDKRSLRTGLVQERGIITSAYICLKPIKDIDSRFFNYQLHSYDVIKVFYNMGNGVRQGLNFSEFSHLLVFEPPLDEQKRIADYLDAKCAEIDALTADIQAQIDTLEQYKRSVVFSAVSHGTAPSRMKKTESDVWTTIPSNWELADIKYLFEIVKRIAGKEGYDILSVTQKGLKVKDISSNEGQIASDYSGYQFVYPTDFVMNHMDLLTGWVDCSTQFGVTSPDYRVFRLCDKEQNNLHYYKYVMQCCYMCRIFYSLGQGVSQLGRWRLQTSVFNNFKAPVPPTDKQKEIAEYLDNKCAEIDAIIDQKNEQLSALDAYKKSLIYEYITGKKEVK
jgi:hypothetical protein